MSNKRTPIGKFIHTTWGNLQLRCANGKYRQDTHKNVCYRNILLCIEREEFKQWCLDREKEILSFNRPSIDRIDKDQHYTFDNIQVIELAENIAKEKLKFKDGFGICFRCKHSKPISEFVKDKRRQMTGRSNICLGCERIRCREKNIRLRNK